MGNKKRKQSSEAAPKITYGLSRSMIEQQQLKSASLIVPSSPTSVVTPSKSQKKKRKKSSDSQSTENLRKDSYCNNSPTEVSQNELETEQVHDINFMEKEGPAPMPTIGSESIESTEYIQFNVGESRTGAIVYTSQSRILHVSGMCTVKLLSGKGNINGYRLRIGEEISIQSPPWVPAIRLFFEPMMSTEVSNKRMVRELVNTSSYLQPHQETLMKTLTSSMGIIEIISVDLACQNWMIRCEDYSKYKSTNTRSGSLLFLDSAVIGESSDLNTLGLDSQILPTDWVISGDLFCKAIKSAPRAVIFGAKGVGK